MSTELTQPERDQFEQVLVAAEEHVPELCVGLCLMRTKHKVTGKDVALLCRSVVVDDAVNIYPLARIITPDEVADYEQPDTDPT